MPAAGNCQRSSELAARGWLWRSRAVPRWWGPDSARPGFAEASAGSGLLAAPPAVAPALFAVEAEPSLESASPRSSGILSSPGVVDGRRGPGRTGRLRPGAATEID